MQQTNQQRAPAPTSQPMPLDARQLGMVSGGKAPALGTDARMLKAPAL